MGFSVGRRELTLDILDVVAAVHAFSDGDFAVRVVDEKDGGGGPSGESSSGVCSVEGDPPF